MQIRCRPPSCQKITADPLPATGKYQQPPGVSKLAAGGSHSIPLLYLCHQQRYYCCVSMSHQDVPSLRFIAVVFPALPVPPAALLLLRQHVASRCSITEVHCSSHSKLLDHPGCALCADACARLFTGTLAFYQQPAAVYSQAQCSGMQCQSDLFTESVAG